MASILVVDDEYAICQAFSQILGATGHTVLIAADGPEALQMLQQESPAAVFLDIQLPGMNGLDVLATIQATYPDLPVIIITAHGTMQTAMQAMQRGAFDYLTKPLELETIRDTVHRILTRPATHADKEVSSQTEQAPDRITLIGQSAAIQEIFKLMGLLTTNDLTVLLTGESGVGKELVARAIHFHSERNNRPFMAFNCAAVPEHLIESELFGHERGAFTGADSRRIGRFEAAEDGTLFLDEIGEMPYHMQSKLLRALQERSFERVGSVTPLTLNARVMAATNRDLESEVNAGRFREDLYYRLKLVTLDIPPLRKRGGDITLLAQHFLRQANQELKRHISAIEPSALASLQHYPWPGNVRELEHVIKHAVLMAHGTTLTRDDLSLATVDSSPQHDSEANRQALQETARAALRQALSGDQHAAEPGSLFHELVSVTERALIDEALKMTNGNQVAAAKLLGLHRTTMRKKIDN